MHPLRLLAAAVITLSAAAASAQSAATMHKALTAEAQRLRAWTSNALLINAVKAQNGRKTALAEIQRIDAEWRSGKIRGGVTTGECADHLRRLASEQPYYVELFVSDNQGALVCSNAVTSDYWQGDEDKWTRAFAAGKGAVFIDRPRFDESAKSNLGAISLPIMDGSTAIGVLTVGVFTDKLPK
jgi:hypothetical protein